MQGSRPRLRNKLFLFTLSHYQAPRTHDEPVQTHINILKAKEICSITYLDVVGAVKPSCDTDSQNSAASGAEIFPSKGF